MANYSLGPAESTAGAPGVSDVVAGGSLNAWRDWHRMAFPDANTGSEDTRAAPGSANPLPADAERQGHTTAPALATRVVAPQARETYRVWEETWEESILPAPSLAALVGRDFFAAQRQLDMLRYDYAAEAAQLAQRSLHETPIPLQPPGQSQSAQRVRSRPPQRAPLQE